MKKASIERPLDVRKNCIANCTRMTFLKIEITFNWAFTSEYFSYVIIRNVLFICSYIFTLPVVMSNNKEFLEKMWFYNNITVLIYL